MKYTEWETPQDFFDTLDAEFYFTLDVCASETNHKCKCWFSKEMDGLAVPWRYSTAWMNPPYGRNIGKWVQKAYEYAKHDGRVVCLLPGNSSEQAWWHDYVMKAYEIRYVRKRLYFGKDGVFTRSNHPSIVVVFRPGCTGPPTVSSIDTMGNPIN